MNFVHSADLLSFLMTLIIIVVGWESA